MICMDSLLVFILKLVSHQAGFATAAEEVDVRQKVFAFYAGDLFLGVMFSQLGFTQIRR